MALWRLPTWRTFQGDTGRSRRGTCPQWMSCRSPTDSALGPWRPDQGNSSCQCRCHYVSKSQTDPQSTYMKVYGQLLLPGRAGGAFRNVSEALGRAIGAPRTRQWQLVGEGAKRALRTRVARCSPPTRARVCPERTSEARHRRRQRGERPLRAYFWHGCRCLALVAGWAGKALVRSGARCVAVCAWRACFWNRRRERTSVPSGTWHAAADRVDSHVGLICTRWAGCRATVL